ncbi:hypothetical protein EX895_003334 [Sporisorium graminicola]|uniref:RlpA-like protein double-psi beta-barrel domain-containing protein n=1 Tax=Sporisorium graminicola TaxID=280036 RepID=A0A4U7KTG4_9BASI|nr:hypothetical protein EX895_003334 [Sporisorium graminicola]TKY87753.1 hypothetical protein EX895_003334 [Sporisorium graminicola]
MICAKTLLFAFVALSLSLMTVAQAAQPTISHNAAVRRHAAMLEARPARRSVAVGDGKMIMQKRQTAEQLSQAAALKQWDDDFHAKNAEWQKAAMAALAEGKTPPTYDQYWDGKSGGSSSSSSSSDSGSSSSSSSDSGSSDATSAAPQQDQSSGASTQDNSGSESDDCAEQDSNNDATPAAPSSSAPSATSSKGAAAAAAATGSKNNAAHSNSNASSSSSSQATSGHFGGQATYYAPGLGACGWTNTESDYIVAISASLFDSFGTGNPNKNPACGHKISASYGGKTITVSVADRCVGCAWGDLDFTPTGFSQLADMSKGRLSGLTWSWIDSAP